MKLFVIILAICAASTTLAYGGMKQPWIGEPAPLFNLPDLDSKSVSLAELRGKIVVLHFGAGW